MSQNNNFLNFPDPHLEPELDPITLGTLHSVYLKGYAREGFEQMYDYMREAPQGTTPEFSMETIFASGGVYEVLRRKYIHKQEGYLDIEFTKMPQGDMAAFRYHRVGEHVMRLPLTLQEVRRELNDLSPPAMAERKAYDSWDSRLKTQPRAVAPLTPRAVDILPRQRTAREKVGAMTRRVLLRAGIL